MTNPLQSRLEALDKPMRPIDIGHEFEATETFPDAADGDPIGFFRGAAWAVYFTLAFAGAAFLLYCVGVGVSRFAVWLLNP